MKSQTRKRLEREAEKVAERVGRNVVRAAPQVASRVKEQIGAALGLGSGAAGAARATAGQIAARAASVVLAGVAAFYGTRKLQEAYDRLGSEDQLADWQLAVTNVWRNARRDAERQLGRSLTQAERNDLKAQFSVYYEQNRLRHAADRSTKAKLASGLRLYSIPF